jgi:hypothetical protein
LAVNALVVNVPDVALVPDHAPDAVQLVALVDDHVKFEVAPDDTEVGDADSVSAAPATATVVAAVIDPPDPAHTSVYVVLAVNALVVELPDVALLPVQPPDAVQLVALVDDHVSLEVPPAATDVGDADSVAVGAVPTVPTVTVRGAVFHPPAPVQVSLNVVLAVNAPVVELPEVALVPVQPPDAIQLVALVDDHVSLEVPPADTDAGAADSFTVGAGPTETASEADFEPAAPVHVSLNVVVAFNAPVAALPDNAFEPDHPPDAVQRVALVDDHVSLAVAPGTIADGKAVRVTVGRAAACDPFAAPNAKAQINQTATEPARKPIHERSCDILRITVEEAEWAYHAFASAICKPLHSAGPCTCRCESSYLYPNRSAR